MEIKYYVLLLLIGVFNINYISSSSDKGKTFLSKIFKSSKSSNARITYIKNDEEPAQDDELNEENSEESKKTEDAQEEYTSSYQEEGATSYQEPEGTSYQGYYGSYNHGQYQTPYQHNYSTGYSYQQWPYNNYYQQNYYEPEVTRDHDCTCGVVQHRRYRIYDGEPASHQDYPWLAQLIMKHLIDSVLKGMDCTGALITMLHILAAAHCFTTRFYSGYARLNDGYAHDLGRIIMPDGYNEETPRPSTMDIAISMLKNRATLGYSIAPICLPTEDEDFTDTIALAAGWGWIDDKGTDSEGLRKAYIPIMSNEQCDRESDWPWAIPDHMFCSGYSEGGPDTCRGDSGAPMMVAGQNEEMIAAGVVSYGEGCGQPKYPGLNMKVSAYLPWILRTIGNEKLCQRP